MVTFLQASRQAEASLGQCEVTMPAFLIAFHPVLRVRNNLIIRTMETQA